MERLWWQSGVASLLVFVRGMHPALSHVDRRRWCFVVGDTDDAYRGATALYSKALDLCPGCVLIVRIRVCRGLFD